MSPKDYPKLIIDNINKVLVGKEEIVELSVITFLAGGHLLIEDVPGVGKTTLANLLAKSVDCEFSRIQFTPDTLPGDIVGASIYNMKSGEFQFIPGAIMSNIVLVDEINRASPKTQSALLESMEEGQITVDKITYPLDDPFLVIATQNPIEFIGTHHLPEAQMDRFLMRLSIGYPQIAKEHEMADNYVKGLFDEEVNPAVTRDEVIQMRKEVKTITVSSQIIDYVVKIITATRSHQLLSLGASPRATLGLISAARGCAYMNGRNYVIPDDVKRVASYVLCHRLTLTVEAKMNQKDLKTIVANILDQIRVPV